MPAAIKFSKKQIVALKNKVSKEQGNTMSIHYLKFTLGSGATGTIKQKISNYQWRSNMAARKSSIVANSDNNGYYNGNIGPFNVHIKIGKGVSTLLKYSY